MEKANIGKAIASMTLGIVSASISSLAIIVPFFSLFLGSLIAVAAFVCGIVAIGLSIPGRHDGRGIAGMVLGIIGTSIAGCILAIILILVCFFQFSFC